MSSQRKRAWQVFVLWGSVLVVFLLLFFVGTGTENWGEGRNSRFISAVLFGVGYIGFFLIQYKGRKDCKDEREILLQQKAGQVTMIFLVMYVYLYGIITFVRFENTGLIPARWMWFLAYTTVFLTYVVNSGTYLFNEKRVGGYGKG